MTGRGRRCDRARQAESSVSTLSRKTGTKRTASATASPTALGGTPIRRSGRATRSISAIMATTALITYLPIAKWVDRAASPRPFIGVTFLLFAIFPISLVLLPRAAATLGAPVIVAFVIAYVLNGLRELGEPARKALITTGFDPAIRARAVGVYWGLRSFAFFPAPMVAALLWFGSIGVFRQVAKADPQMSQVYLRQLRYRSYYPPRSRPYRDAKWSSCGFYAGVAITAAILLYGLL